MNDAREIRSRASASGLTPDDVAWFDGFGWRPERTPPVESDAQRADYARREAALNAAIANLSFSERGESPEGKLAAMIGARLADWRERDQDDDDK